MRSATLRQVEEIAAMFPAEALERCEALAVALSNDDIGPLLLLSVLEGIGYDRVDPPMGRRQWYALRKRFFRVLEAAEVVDLATVRRWKYDRGKW